MRLEIKIKIDHLGLKYSAPGAECWVLLSTGKNSGQATRNKIRFSTPTIRQISSSHFSNIMSPQLITTVEPHKPGKMGSTEPTTSPILAPPAPLFKEFRCVWGNCTKSFSRAEHLHRHALNHDESRANLTCERCSAVFKRKDLIGRLSSHFN